MQGKVTMCFFSGSEFTKTTASRAAKARMSAHETRAGHAASTLVDHVHYIETTQRVEIG